jgi:glycolate oxidase iron-sulfur subunit
MSTAPTELNRPDLRQQIDACVHCGFCLPACPTYLETGDEADSPRGRLHLMRAMMDGRLTPGPTALAHLERCLVCRACEVACPSGVEYHNILELVRPVVSQAVLQRPQENRILQFLVSHVLPYAGRVRLSILPLQLARIMGLSGLVQRIAQRLPAPLPAMTSVLPPVPLLPVKIPQHNPAIGPRRGSVVLLTGCVGSVVSQGLNAACVRVLTANGFDVNLLPDEGCCGAMAAHVNMPDDAGEFARNLVERLERRSEDYFVSAIAGCGAQLKSLDHVLAASPQWHKRAHAVVTRMRDITELLAAVGLTRTPGALPYRVTYHDPCHLLNAQKLRQPPRQLLAAIPGLKIVDLPETDVCCGAAGAYNLAQPAMAETLGQRKVANIKTTNATVLATANVGCALQIERHLAKAGITVRVCHVIELLDESYQPVVILPGLK